MLEELPELPEAGPAKASEAAETLIVRSGSDEPRLRGRAPDVDADTGEAFLIRGSSAGTIPDPFRFGRPGQLASIMGSEIGTDVPLLETVDDASDSVEKNRSEKKLQFLF